MTPEHDKALCEAFPLLYSDRGGNMRSTAMCWGFSCGDGWFDLIWRLSAELEPLIRKLVDGPCAMCGHAKKKHSATRCAGSFRKTEYTDGGPCGCVRYLDSHPRASQVKEKYGGLRFYLTSSTPEMEEAVHQAEMESIRICEVCGEPGHIRDNAWIRTLCHTHARAEERE